MPASPPDLQHQIPRRLSVAILAVLLATCTLVALPGPETSPAHREWLEQVDPILTDEERLAFASLDRHYQREAFIARFWHERAGFLDIWLDRLNLSEKLFGTVVGDRALTLLQIGPPEFILADLCPEIFHPLEAWFYPQTENHPGGFYLVFARPGVSDDTPYRHWSPAEETASLELEPTTEDPTLEGCVRRREWEEVVANAVDSQALRSDRELYPPPPPPWVSDFLDHTTDIDPSSPIMTASLSLTFPGSLQERTVVQAELTIPTEIATLGESDNESFHLQLDGDILRRDNLLDQFRYRFEFPVAEITDHAVPLAFQRYLLPGQYTMILRLEDLNSGSVFRNEGPLRVPSASEIESRPKAPLAEANAALGARDHLIKIQPLADQLYTGRVRVEARATGMDIARVTFVLNGHPLMSKTRPPYSLEIDLGHAPRLHSLEAIAYDASGLALARDRVPINGGPHRFSVRLLEPRSGERYVQSLRAAAEVHLPADEKLDRVEFFLNETPVASLFQPPYVQPLLLPQNQRITYVRAVAYLEDGNSTEDMIFVNAPDDMAHLRINMIELYTTVSDKKGHPVEGLQGDVFVVREEGQEQAIRRFDLVNDLPIHAAVAIDASTSMEEELTEALQGALAFFSSVIQPKDRAAVIVFNDEPILEVPFTNDLEILSQGLTDVESEGETALYDTLAFSLFYFAGIRGKRALIVISDGEDSNSRHSLDEVMEFAQRSGVAIYSIALGLNRQNLEARSVLMRLARETGGRYFSIGRAQELGGIYQAIERELRSQYLLVYQSTHEEGGAFRKVEVKVAVPGLKAKTIPGYYP